MAEYTRREMYLAVIAGGTGPVPVPVTREDYLFAKIAGADVPLPEPPYTRYEAYLAKLAGAYVTAPQPGTQLEKFLYAACGYNVTLPVPVTREEVLWEAIINADGLRIIGQPEDQTVDGGQTAYFTVKVTGGMEPYTYRWYYRTSPTDSWTAVSAASGKTANYSLTAQARHNGYQYYCKVTDADGATAESNIATLTVT